MRSRTHARCLRCGAELKARGPLAKRAHAEGLCCDCWLEPPRRREPDREGSSPQPAEVV
jgi:hypothetical protein